MGNAESNVTSGVKKQTDAGAIALYKLVDLKGICTRAAKRLLLRFVVYSLVFVNIDRWRTAGGHDEAGFANETVRGNRSRDQDKSRAVFVQQGQRQMDTHSEAGALEEQRKGKIQNGEGFFVRSISDCCFVKWDTIVAQLPVLKAMEKPEDYDIDKDMANEPEPDENAIGNNKSKV